LAQTIPVHLQLKQMTIVTSGQTSYAAAHICKLPIKEENMKSIKSHFYKYDIITHWAKHSARSSLWWWGHDSCWGTQAL